MTLEALRQAIDAFYAQALVEGTCKYCYAEAWPIDTSGESVGPDNFYEDGVVGFRILHSDTCPVTDLVAYITEQEAIPA